jgi:addiction module HigA family antidote
MRIPTHRKPTHPGAILKTYFLVELSLTSARLAEAIGVTPKTISELINEHAGISPEMAMRLSRFFRISEGYWLNLQMAWDLWHAKHGPAAKKIERIKPLETAIR